MLPAHAGPPGAIGRGPFGPRRLTIFRAALVTLILACIVFQIGCAKMLGARLVTPPNQGKSIQTLGDASLTELAQRGVSEQFRVTVGPPAASLSVWVMDPPRQDIVNVKLPDMHGGRHTWVFGRTDRPPFKIADPLGTILVLHGIYDSKESFSGVWGRIFAGAGYRTVLVDLRGHGRSTGQWMTYGVVEAQDVSQVITALEKRRLIVGKLGVFGISYGGAVAIETAALDPRIKAVATMGAFSSLRDVVPPFGQHVVTRRLGSFAWWFLKGMIPDVIDQAGHAADFDPDQANPCMAIAHTTAPVLLLHGTADVNVPPSEAQTLYDAAQGPVRLVFIPGATHLGLFFLCLSDVRWHSLNWFDRWLITSPPAPAMARMATVEKKEVGVVKVEGKGAGI